jgi:CRISPR-associated endonuclease Csn1
LSKDKSGTTLGLDIGTNSIGWALLEQKGSDQKILGMGIRIFEASVEGSLENIKQGKDSSRATKRPEPRLPRRQNWRTQQRKRNLFLLLVQSGLLPETNDVNSVSRNKILEGLDSQLRKRHLRPDDHESQQLLPFLLRSQALETQLDPFELGRALYSLSQRRGYQSNRKGADTEDEKGKILTAISKQGQKLKVRTLAQYYSETTSKDRHIRGQYTARKMLIDEFDRIRSCQEKAFSN